MEKVYEDLNYAMNKILVNDNDSLFGFIYPFATENIDGYLSQLDVKDKSVLTVAASGDQTLNLLLNGCKNIDTFDISPLTKYYMNLKIAAVKALTHKEYLKYFCYADYSINGDNKRAFNIKTYQKISPYLDKYTKMFWDNLYLELDGLEIRGNNKLFTRDEYYVQILNNINSYLKDNNYKKLKKILLKNDYKINFYNTNIKHLPNILQNKYDLIMLSNIYQYVDLMYKNNPDLNFKKLIYKMSDYLNDNGKILLHYSYGVNKNDINNEINVSKLNKLFDNDLDLLIFESIRNSYVIGDTSYDLVPVYKKSKIK